MSVCGKGSKPNPGRQSMLVAAALALALAGCSGKPDESRRGTIGFVQGFLGGVAADEPRAALVGREILSVGGSAADAAVATYFALAVTLPSTATLGGGGICLAHDPGKEKAQMLDFVAPSPKSVHGPGAAAIPMNARGFFVLHARYGRLKWERLAAPAANLARFGAPVSRALARDLAQAGGALSSDAETWRIFGRQDGAGPLREGDRLTQIDLAAILDRIRTQGPGELYVGEGARGLIRDYRSAGFALDRDELKDAVPVWRDVKDVLLEYKDRRAFLYFTVPPALAGTVAARIVADLAEKDRYARANATARAPMFVETARRAQAMSPPVLTAGSTATAFVAADRDGQVVACVVTPYRPFGIGRVAPGSGILVVPPPAPGTGGPEGLAAVIVNNHRREGVVFAAASGGANAAAAIAQVAAQSMLEGYLLEDALAQARLLPPGPAGGAPHEAIVNALACPGGLGEKPQTCSLRADPRGLGLAAMSD